MAPVGPIPSFYFVDSVLPTIRALGYFIRRSISGLLLSTLSKQRVAVELTENFSILNFRFLGLSDSIFALTKNSRSLGENPSAEDDSRSV